MGRPAIFDRQHVIQEALELFWSRGFFASSIAQLEEVTELQSGSLYYRFQSKEQLYIETLDYYVQHQLQERIQRYLVSKPSALNLRRFFTSGYRHKNELSYRNSCFLVNSCTERHLLPDKVQLLITQGFTVLQQGINHCLNKLYSSLCDTVKGMLINSLEQLYISIQITAKIDSNQHRLDHKVQQTLSLIECV